MSSTDDKVNGLGNEIAGNAKQAAGVMTGDNESVTEGKLQELKGHAQKTLGEAKDSVRHIVEKVTGHG